ncbi:MAG: hypothetical protein IPN79_08240 [Saprospiraceae bacterium]|nr:hypothetical protein [Saprospiraceae bacterium]
MKHFIFFGFILVCVGACSPKYFEIPEDSIIQNKTGLDYWKWNKYEFNLKPYDIFKNNINTTLLLSDSTILKKYLFNVGAKADVYHNDYSFIEDSWYKMEVYIQTLTENGEPAEGSKVLLKSISGRNQRDAKLLWIFSGRVGSTFENKQIVYLDSYTEYRGKNKKCQPSFKASKSNVVKPFLTIITGKADTNQTKKDLFVYAMIDNGFNNKSKIPLIYEMRRVFGSELLLTCKN